MLANCLYCLVSRFIVYLFDQWDSLPQHYESEKVSSIKGLSRGINPAAENSKSRPGVTWQLEILVAEATCYSQQQNSFCILHISIKEQRQ